MTKYKDIKETIWQNIRIIKRLYDKIEGYEIETRWQNIKVIKRLFN